MPVVFVTGASTGIGLETAVAFARKGYRVYAGVRSPEKADLLEAAISQGLPISTAKLDVNEDESVKRAVEQVLGESAAIDVLVNNAGIGGGGPVELVPISLSKEIFETNYFGAIRMIRAVLPGMRERRSGAIVNVTSAAGRVAVGSHAHYSATKFALEAASESLAAEVAPHGIRVVLVEPGCVLTPIWQKAEGEFSTDGPYGLAVRRLFRIFDAQLAEPTMPDEIADVIVHAVETDQPRLRYPAGKDAEFLIPGRHRLTDEEWIALQTEPDEDRFVARAREIFGIDLYNPPSARARTAGNNG
jgi:NAD(P)-dependent dehydrogenase (short-subunit alcohol dehydrogenase family)